MVDRWATLSNTQVSTAGGSWSSPPVALTNEHRPQDHHRRRRDHSDTWPADMTSARASTSSVWHRGSVLYREQAATHYGHRRGDPRPVLADSAGHPAALAELLRSCSRAALCRTRRRCPIAAGSERGDVEKQLAQTLPGTRTCGASARPPCSTSCSATAQSRRATCVTPGPRCRVTSADFRRGVDLLLTGLATSRG